MSKSNKKKVTKAAKVTKLGPTALRGSVEARRLAAVLMEVLSGVIGPGEGSEQLGISLNRYYQLETRGLQGLIEALEKKGRGRAKTPERMLAEVEKENDRLRREISRHQALLRGAHRSLGIKSPVKRKMVNSGRKSKRRKVSTVRATKIASALRVDEIKAMGVKS